MRLPVRLVGTSNKTTMSQVAGGLTTEAAFHTAEVVVDDTPNRRDA
jgi:hypothetical protein